jgi:hypothetical protein
MLLDEKKQVQRNVQMSKLNNNISINRYCNLMILNNELLSIQMERNDINVFEIYMIEHVDVYSTFEYKLMIIKIEEYTY